MSLAPRSGHEYQDNNIGGNSRVHIGDAYHQHGPSPDERTSSAILENLSYPGMFDRWDALGEAHEGTFDWTFLQGKSRFLTERWAYRTVDVNLKTWLHDEKGCLFCVKGKAGSGKSTFMYDGKVASTPCGGATDLGYRKSLSTKTQLEAMLQTWAAGQTLLRADHYFWILGPPKQKSIEGLLRSMLYTALRSLSLAKLPDKIDAIKQICSTRWQSSNKQGTWTCKELREMISRLASVQGVKIFFLVDALDECEPQDCLGDLADVVL
jgi:hypothetical protein